MRSRRFIRVVGMLLSKSVVFGSFAVFALLAVGPRTGAYRTLSVLTGSMRPGMPAGTMIVAAPISALSVKPGDVVVYRAPIEDHRIVTHRVVSAHQSGGAILLQTKGDANTANDPWVARISEPVIWKVRGSVPFAGTVISKLHTPAMRRFSLLFVPFLIAFTWIKDLWRSKPMKPSKSDGSKAGVVSA